MHALAPVIATAAPSPAHRVPGGATPHGHRASTGVMAHAHCPGAGDCGGGHVHHADPTCASAALDGPPTAPALAPSPLDPVRPRTRPAGAGRHGSTADGPRPRWPNSNSCGSRNARAAHLPPAGRATAPCRPRGMFRLFLALPSSGVSR
nr:DUF6153 family protein [Streptomyces sp. MOE7]